MRKPYQIIIISIITGILVISCNLTSRFPGISKNVPTSTAISVVVPDQIVIEPTIIVSTDSVIVTFTEADVLSWIQQYQSSGADILLKDPVVKLDDGVAQISGIAESEFISGEVLVQFSLSVGTDGTPIVTIVKMQIGGMDLPESMNTQFSGVINQSISNSMQNELDGRSIQSITIDDGLMTIQTSN